MDTIQADKIIEQLNEIIALLSYMPLAQEPKTIIGNVQTRINLLKQK